MVKPAWSNLKDLDPATLANEASNYVRALFLKKDWSRLLQLTFDPLYADEVLAALKVPFVRKQLFRESTAEAVLGFLDSANDVFRRQVLTNLIETFEKDGISLAVGEALLKEAKSHAWVQTFSTYRTSLQSDDFLRSYLKCEAPGINTYLSPTDVVPLRLLAKRKRIGGFVVDAYIDALNQDDSTKRCATLQNLLHFKDLWWGKSEVTARLKEAVRTYRYRYSGNVQLESVDGRLFLDSSDFPVSKFYEWDFVNEEFILQEYFLGTAEAEKDLPLERQTFTLALGLAPLQGTDRYTNFLAVLASLSVEEPENPLGQLWKRVVAARPYAYFRNFVDTCGGHFPRLVNSLGTEQRVLSLEGAKSLLAGIVRLVLDYKKDIVRDDPARYTQLVTCLLQILVSQGQFANGPEYWAAILQFRGALLPSYLQFLPEDLADSLVREAVVEPSGKKPLNPILAQAPGNVSLSVILLIGNLKTLAEVIEHGKRHAVSDDFGFVAEFSLNFPPLPTEKSLKAEPWTGSVHAFERALIKKRLLQHPDLQLAVAGINLYKQFVLKILGTANQSSDKKLLEYAVGAHYRLCRFLLGKTRDDIRQTYTNLLINLAVHPLALSVGQKTDESFATRLFESVIVHVPAIGTDPQYPHPLYSIVHRLLHRSSCALLPNSDAVAAAVASLALDRLFRKLPPVWKAGVPGYTFDEVVLPSNNIPNVGHWEKVDAKVAAVVPAGFRDLVLRHLFSKKAAVPFKAPLLDRAAVEPPGAGDGNFGPSAKVFRAVVEFIAQRLEGYDDSQCHLSSTALIGHLLQELKGVFTGAVAISLKSPIPADIDRYVKKHDYNAYTQSLAQFRLTVSLSFGAAPLLQDYAALAGSALFAEFLSDLVSDDRYAQFQKVLSFVPRDPDAVRRANLPPYQQRTEAAYTPQFTVRFSESPYVNYRFQNLPPPCPSRAPPKAKAKPAPKAGAWKLDKFSGALAEVIAGPILRLDGDKFIAGNPGAQSFFAVASALAKFARELRTPPADVALFGPLIRAVVSDLCIVDPEPTEEQPSPPPTPTFFANVTGVPAPKAKAKGAKAAAPRPVKGGRRGRARPAVVSPQAKPVGLPQFFANKFLLALLASGLRKSGLVGRVDFSAFTDQLLALLSQPEDQLQRKLGGANQYFYANEVALFVLGKITFGESPPPLDGSASAAPLVQVYFRFLASSAFHDAAVDVLFQHLQGLSSHALRQTILATFLSGFFSDAFSYTMHTRTRLTSWALSPSVVGFPLPAFSLAFAARLAEDEKLHVDVRRTLLASTVAYFNFQAVAGAGPVHADELFAVLDKVVGAARDAITAACVWAVRDDLAASLRSRASGFAELLPAAQSPAKFAAIPGVAVAFPRNGDWKPLYGRFVSSYVGAGLLTGNPQLLLLVIAALTVLCAETTEVSSKIVPFIGKGLAQIEPGRPSNVLVTFAYHFCFLKENSGYTDLIDSFVDVFARLRTYTDGFVRDHEKDLWNSAKAPSLIVALNAYIAGFTQPFPELVSRAVGGASDDPGVGEWFQTLAKRLLEALRTEERLPLRIQTFDTLADWLRILSRDEFREALQVWGSEESWRPILKLARGWKGPHQVFYQYIGQARPLPPALLPEIAEWEDDTGLVATFAPYVRNAVTQWLETDVDAETRARVLPGLWRFSLT
jgi:hypothetical protein